ncbi:Sec-independent protein secretion pathway component TatC [Lentisphaera araneosa HTCC2155]|uniref:Sec-independent protein translocase protein TatC n=1 Tax=Lentisphaera araneosa HTCC2155 TaxID=313628 RepID=A6DU15_9BACT|nr:twin-arginine translocase subunit TatC [Lentisphaera araneosa]EDM24881.1 Sec-independent protein secretion pathway component TatC [Lentisphaera araneosa HTCC2155]
MNNYDDYEENEEQLQEMGLLDHLNDLRVCLFKALIALIILFPFGAIMSKPLIGQLTSMTKVPTLQAIMPAETFMEQLKVGLIIAAFLLIPYLTFLAWNFISPALYDKEKKWGKNIVVSSTLLFLAGAMFAYYQILPATLDFFYSQNIPGVEYKPRLASVTGFALQICGASGLMAQLPVITTILYALNIVSLEKLRSSRSIVFISILVVSALLTPPDVFSQCMIGIPAYAIFEISLFLCGLIESKREGKSIRQKIQQAVIALIILLGGGAYFMVRGADYLEELKLKRNAPVTQISVEEVQSLIAEPESRIKLFSTLEQSELPIDDRQLILGEMTQKWNELEAVERARLVQSNFTLTLISNEASLDLELKNHANLPLNFRAQWAFELDDKTYLWPNNEFVYQYKFRENRPNDHIILKNINLTLPALQNMATWSQIKPILLILEAKNLDDSNLTELNKISPATPTQAAKPQAETSD